MVAAVLTIIGFSINDTIVIFDRIREDLKLGVRGSFKDLINQALNQTLSRTIITSGTVFLATMSLYLFGGGAINDFAFTFLVGIITGTYSSIYIASALVLWWHKGQRPKAANQVMVESSVAGLQPAKKIGA
jgi:SecD/SecF fusion protein